MIQTEGPPGEGGIRLSDTIMLYYTSQPSGQGDKRRIVSLRKRHERDFHKYDGRT